METELFERFSSPVSNRDERLGAKSPFWDRIIALRWGLDRRQAVVAELFGDVARRLFDQ